MSPTFEFRKLFRATIALRVEYRAARDPLVAGVAFSKNISSTGINLVMPEHLEKNTELELRIYLPGATRPVVAKAKVIWLSECLYMPESRRHYYSIGLQFDHMSTEDAICTSDYVRHVINKQIEEQTKGIIEMLEKEKGTSS